MRLRWVAITFVLLGSIIAVYDVCHERGGSLDTIIGMCRRISYGMLFGAGFWGASHVLKRWMNQPELRFASRAAKTPAPPAPPVPHFEIPDPAADGRYRVRGFDRDTHFETVEFVYADSPSNAQMKVELKGVEVAVVERAG